MRRAALLLVCLLATHAAAQLEDGGAEAPVDESAEAAQEEEAPEVTERIEALEEQLRETQAAVKVLQQQADAARQLHVQFFGALDVGFFWVGGNGAGVRKDFGRLVPGTDDILASWVLIGDPLSTAINARGDVADLGDSRALRFDPIHSQGRPSFIVNAVSLGFMGNVGEDLHFTALVDFLPRDAFVTGAAFGDFVDIKLAWAQWRHDFGGVQVAVSAGKIDSLHGFEYRAQEPGTRLTVTPSLLSRYTCGRAVGLKAQVFLLDETLEFALALTNGSAQTELFPWSNETDWNGFKTVSARSIVRVGPALELTASGAVGAQDRQPDDALMQWHVGGGVRARVDAFVAMLEFVRGRAPGKDAGEVKCGAASCLQYIGAYGLFSYRLAHLVTPYVRVDWRQSSMRNGRLYAYESNELRTTIGVRVEPLSRLMLKAEYTFNAELFGPAFPNDVFTSSAVVVF